MRQWCMRCMYDASEKKCGREYSQEKERGREIVLLVAVPLFESDAGRTLLATKQEGAAFLIWYIVGKERTTSMPRDAIASNVSVIPLSKISPSRRRRRRRRLGLSCYFRRTIVRTIDRVRQRFSLFRQNVSVIVFYRLTDLLERWSARV